MGVQLSVSEIVADASQLSDQELEALVGQLNLMRAQRAVPALSKVETELLMKINEGFSSTKWLRLVELDEQMEISDLTESEAAESMALAQELEAYTVERLKHLKKLAEIRGVPVESLMKDLGLTHQ